MKNILNTILKMVIFTFLLFCGVVLATSKFDNPLGIRSFVVLTDSMRPGIPAGSIIFTQSTLNYSEGDIITFKQGNVTVTHRIVNSEIKNGKTIFKTKGDANNNVDGKPVDRNDIYGKELASIPFAGNLILFMRTIPGFFVFIILPAFVYLAFEFMTIKKELEKQIEKKYQTNIMRKLPI